MATNNSAITNRVIYSHLRAGNPLADDLIIRILQLKQIATSGRSEDTKAISQDEIAHFRLRAARSEGIIAYLIPDETSMRDFLRSSDVEKCQLLATGFFGTTTAMVHDLCFDYEAIDELTNPTDKRADLQLLKILLEDRSNRYVMALIRKSEERLRVNLEELGFEVQLSTTNEVAMGRDGTDGELELSRAAKEHSLPTVNSTTRHCDPEPATDEYLVEEFRKMATEAAGFEIDSRVAELAFGSRHSLLGEAREWGTSDTVVREACYKHLSEFLLGRSWPRGIDFTEEGQFEEFLRQLEEAHERLKSAL